MHSKEQTPFKATQHLQYRENVHFLLASLILRLYTGCRLDQTLNALLVLKE